MNESDRLLVNHTPLIYVIFIGGAADKESFLWGNVKLPFDQRRPHYMTYHLARRFHFRLRKYLQTAYAISPSMINQYYRCDYLSYSEVFYRDARRYEPDNLSMRIEAPAFQRLLQNIGSQTQVFIVGHSLGAWNGAHLSHLLAAHGISCRYLITLDPVGYGNHDFPLAGHLIRLAKIYPLVPVPVCANWINIRGFHIRLRHHCYSRTWRNWVSWAGGQWLVKDAQSQSQLLANEATSLPHHWVEEMFNYPTQLGYSANTALQQEIATIVRQSGLIPA